MKLSELQKEIVRTLAEKDDVMTPNSIGYEMGLDENRVEGSGAGWGRGSGHRVFGPAQRIIPPLNGLKKRGLVFVGPRPDGLSGTAYGLTPEGEEAAKELVK